MICPNCGKENPDKAPVCVDCGTDLTEKGQLDRTMSFLLPNKAIEEEKIVDLDKLVTEGPVLVVVKGRNIGDTYPLIKKETLIGRDPISEIFLDDITVSRNHAKIVLGDDLAVISDVGSLNGTYVNRNRIEESRLADRDEIQIGKFKLVFLAKK